jgi:CspA family cold shock protein
MASGTIKWFNEPKGYGFLAPDAGGRDVFAHRGAIAGGGYNSLSEGAKIDFEDVGCAKDPEAKRPTRRLASGHPSEGTNAPLNR